MNTTHFGFKDIPIGEKTEAVRGVFDSVASRYDLMNDVMSGGLHRVWKTRFVDLLHPRDGMRVLDVAGGTGDIAFRIKARAAADVTVCDINTEMLTVGRDRAADKNLLEIPFIEGNAEQLPFQANQLDAYTIAFGIRNVTDIPAALREAHRVLKTGGRFLCLEFSQMPNEKLQALYDRYSFALIPRMGQLIAQDRDSYQYLVESIRKFPNQSAFEAMIAEAGFKRVRHWNLSGGICAIHSGWKV